MPEENQAAPPMRRNPLLWIALAVAGLIVYVVIGGDRRGSMPVSQPQEQRLPEQQGQEQQAQSISSGNIERSLLVPPGMRARQYIEQVRERGKPFPLGEIFERAQKYLQDGSLADAHLLYFFAAREQHLPAIMRMGEMSDPTLFRAEDSLLDHADVIQAYKWYRKAATLGHEAASERLDSLQQWAVAEAASGNPHARQLLLNFQ